MTSGLQRLAAVFVAPAAPAARATPTAPQTVSLSAIVVTVIGGEEAAIAAAGIARACGARVALVCVVGASLPPAAVRAPGLPAAASLAAKLRARGHAARASGRAVLVTADDEELPRILAATRDRDLPLVIACCTGRCAVADAQLAVSDAVVFTATPDAEPLVRDLAVSRLREAAPGTPVVAAVVTANRFAPRPRAAVSAILNVLR